MQNDSDFIVIGRVLGAYGVQGWVKIKAYTSDISNMLQYRPWYLLLKDAAPVQLPKIVARLQGNSVVAHWVGCEDRDQATLHKGAEIAILRQQLPALAEDEYYWSDLHGFTVVTETGITLGDIVSLFETGANDVMVIRGERERLLPYISEVVLSVDPTARVIRVRWDPEF
jgi:16S rRNA processing protein RimM